MNFHKLHPCSRHAANSRSRHAESRRSGKGATLPECVAWRHPCSRHGQAGSDEKFLVAKPLIGMDSAGSGPVQLNWTGPGPDLDWTRVQSRSGPFIAGEQLDPFLGTDRVQDFVYYLYLFLMIIFYK